MTFRLFPWKIKIHSDFIIIVTVVVVLFGLYFLNNVSRGSSDVAVERIPCHWSISCWKQM